MVGLIEVITNRTCFIISQYARSVSIDTLLQHSLGFSHILDATSPARNDIYYIRCSACNTPSDLLGVVLGVAGNQIPFQNVLTTSDTFTVGITPKSALRSWSRNICGKGRDFSSDK